MTDRGGTLRRSSGSTPLWPLYAGGFLGPFGGAVSAPMLPELTRDLDTTIEVAGANLTAYLVPFALLMIVSGTLAERWGRRRSVRAGYLVYAVASVVCVLATGPGVFLAGRAVQGAANAFTTPILVAAIADVVPPARLGRSLGVFGSLQAAGIGFAPLVGGAVTSWDWRLAFWTIAVAGIVLALVPPPDAPATQAMPAHARWRSLRSSSLGLACVVAALQYVTATAMTLLGALLAADRLGLAPGGRGLVVAGFGLAGLAAGALVGRGVNALGVRRLGIVGAAGIAVASALAAVSGSWPMLFGAMLLGGVAGVAGRVTVNNIAVLSAPDNRSGAVSLMLACQFLGGAAAPVLLIPIYRHDPSASLLVAGACALLAIPVLLRIPRTVAR